MNSTATRRLRRMAVMNGRREDGQTLVEFALAAPLLLLLLTAILQFGAMYNRYIVLTDAVRAGARELSLGRGLSNPCDPAVLQTLESASSIGLTSGKVTPSFPSSSDYCGTGAYTYNTSGNSAGNENEGDQATVTATAPFTLTVFGMHVLSVTLSASASDAIE